MLKKLNKKVLTYMRKNIAEITGFVLGISLLSFFLSTLTFNNIDAPTKASDFAKTSVIIMGKYKRSGGSGVILRSSNKYSEILTNKHVCRLVTSGGFVLKNYRLFIINSIKLYPFHDLCLVKVFHNFKVNTKISRNPPDNFDKAIISGHPALLPHVTTIGNFSGHKIINLIVGLKKCKKEDLRSKYKLYCFLFGGIPVLQSFESQLVTGTILPGSSGSGVFNSKGEISGLVFAGQGKGLGYAFIVPQIHLLNFLNIEKRLPYVPVNRIKYDDLIRKVFGLQKFCKYNTKYYYKFKPLCDVREDYMIWSK